MRIYRGLKEIQPPLGPCAVTIGNYDGIHAGHRAIIQKLVSDAKAEGLQAILLTFDPHPASVLHPGRKIQRMFPLSDMEEQLSKAGVDHFIVENFSPELSRLTAADFLETRLLPVLTPKLFVVGHDFAFGAGRTGTLGFLSEWCIKRNFVLRVLPPVEVDGWRVSSRLIRDLLVGGKPEDARHFLGRCFYLEGPVEKGAGRGKTISVPTMNIVMQDRFAPKPGVYVTRTHVSGKTYRSVSNLGVNPTFGDGGELKLETHVFDFSGDAYGKKIRVDFLSFIRDEKKFPNVQELEVQIRRDMETARKFREDA